MKRLVGHEGAQRVDEHAHHAIGDCFAHGMHMEDERFAPARAHDGKGVATALEGVEGLELRAMRSGGTNHRMDE